MEVNLQINLPIVIGIAIISLLFFIVHPLYTREGFTTLTPTTTNVDYMFNGTRWTADQIRTFRETIQKIIVKFDQLQKDLFMTLQEYRTLDSSLLENAKMKKAEILKNEEQIKEASQSGPIPGLTTSDPVEDYYKPFAQIPRSNKASLPLAATTEISSKTGLQYELPTIVLPDTSTLTKLEEYAWIDMPDGKERYDREQTFYVTVATIIPILQKTIGELYINANLLRISAGSKTYSLLPRVEALRREIEDQEKMAKSVGEAPAPSSIEGFQSKESTTCKKTIVYQTEDYLKWTTKTNDTLTVIRQIEKLIQNAEADIQIAKKIMGDIKKKGEAQRATIRKLRRSRIE